MIRTMATFSRQVSLKTGLDLTGGSIADVFTIVGGYIIVEGIIGRLTAACSANACTLAITSDPTVGASDTPIGTAVEMNAATLGSAIYVTGASADAAIKAAENATVPLLCVTPFLLPPGGLDVDLSTSDLTTGTMDLMMIWRACSPEAYVTVA